MSGFIARRAGYGRPLLRQDPRYGEGAALTDDQKRVLRVLPVDRPLLADEAAVMTELPVRRVLSALTMLEIDGYVCRQGAGSFLRTVELREE